VQPSEEQMVRIIKQGVPPTEKIYRAECYTCKSVLEFKQGEATYWPDQREGDHLTLLCPVCRSSVTVNVSDFVSDFVREPDRE
jgi:hypothetical protein